MRKSRFTEAQIVAIVRESDAEGPTVEQCTKKHGITPTTKFRWRKRFGGMDPNQAAELRQLQAENERLSLRPRCGPCNAGDLLSDILG
jgi:putative transposase